MELARLRRISAMMAAIAAVLPFLPALVGSPAQGCFGYRMGSDTCGMCSLGMMAVALVGIACTQSALPLKARRWTLPKVLVVGVVWIVVTSMPM